MNKPDDAVTELVLEALGGWTCQNCGQEMRDSSYCDACCYLFCPHCGMDSTEECEHLVALWDDDRTTGPLPFTENDLPHLPDDASASWPHGWPSDEVVERVFGDLSPLLEAYEGDGLEAPPDQYALWTAIYPLLSEQPPSLNRFVPDSPGSSCYRDAFFEDPETPRAEIAEIVERLCLGFQELAVMGGNRRPTNQVTCPPPQFVLSVTNTSRR